MERRDEWEALRPAFARAWEAQHRDTGVHWLEVEEGFHYGWDAGHSPAYAGCSWDQAEPDLAQHWFRPELESEESNWDYVREAVRQGWERARARAA